MDDRYGVHTMRRMDGWMDKSDEWIEKNSNLSQKKNGCLYIHDIYMSFSQCPCRTTKLIFSLYPKKIRYSKKEKRIHLFSIQIANHYDKFERENDGIMLIALDMI